MTKSKSKAVAAIGFWGAVAVIAGAFLTLYLLTALALIAAGFWAWLAWVWFALYAGWFTLKIGKLSVQKWKELVAGIA